MEKDKNQNFFLNPDEMAIRKVYWPLFEERRITKVFRPGSRECGAWRGYCGGQKVLAKAIEKVGADWAEIAPVFAQGKSMPIVINKTEVKKLGDLKESDFEGASPDIKDVQSLRYHLGVLYNLYPQELGPEDFVTIFSFEYE